MTKLSPKLTYKLNRARMAYEAALAAKTTDARLKALKVAIREGLAVYNAIATPSTEVKKAG